MKTTYLAALIWLAASSGALAQFNDHGGPPSASELYGAGPSTPPQMFQKAPPSVPVTSNATANGTANGTANPSPSGAILPLDAATTGNTSTAAAGGVSSTPLVSLLAPDLANVVMPASMELIDNQRILAPGDQFVYEVMEDHDSPVVLFVNVDGEASPHVPYLPPQMRIKASGITLHKLAQNIEEQLENKDLKYYTHATVLLAPYHANNSRGHVNVEGQVKKPGQVPIPASSELTLYEALAAAGGFTDAADGEHVHLIHNDADPAKSFNKVFNIQKDMSEGRETNEIVQPGDFISVLSKTESYSTIAVTGEVLHQLVRPISSNSPPKILDLILDAQFTEWSNHTVRVVHAPESNKPDDFVDMDDILKRGDQKKNITLAPGDQIIVKANFFSFR